MTNLLQSGGFLAEGLIPLPTLAGHFICPRVQWHRKDLKIWSVIWGPGLFLQCLKSQEQQSLRLKIHGLKSQFPQSFTFFVPLSSAVPLCLLAALEVFAHLKGQSEGFPAQQLREDKGRLSSAQFQWSWTDLASWESHPPAAGGEGSLAEQWWARGWPLPLWKQKVMIKNIKKKNPKHTRNNCGKRILKERWERSSICFGCFQG